MGFLFPSGKISDELKLSDAQGAVEGAEYTEAARGKRCGHIFKPNEASYMCRTCGVDETCCLCSRCFDSTDHTGHMVRIHLSVGNSGCCDCGDEEAWRTPLFCTIHSDQHKSKDKGKGREATALPAELVENIQMTVGRVFDYICDVISCAPEQLKETMTAETIAADEEESRLGASYRGAEPEECPLYALVLWNDEKHTVREVTDQVARAVGKTRTSAEKDAWETDAIGRSILTYGTSIPDLLKMAKRLQHIRVTVTIRSARDTFREQMCGTLVEWLSDICGCSVGTDHHILRQTVCEQLMQPWQRGSAAAHIDGVIDDEDEEDQAISAGDVSFQGVNARFMLALQAAAAGGIPEAFVVEAAAAAAGGDDDDDDDEVDAMMEEESIGDTDADEEGEGDDDVMMVDVRGDMTDMGMSWVNSEALEEDEATMAGYPPPPPPPPATTRATTARDRDGSPTDSDPGDAAVGPVMEATANRDVPKTPGKSEKFRGKPPKYWIETPTVYTRRENIPIAEDVFQRVRLDWLLLFDLRMWKKVRNDLRSLYISTVVQVPEFKRVLALRFASLYTILAQLYLIGDREPDHSIINLSLQMLTTPSITAEVVERGNFMTSLLAILYTFLTSRQVGHPWDVSPEAVLGFESGSVQNRRMYHFYQDLKYLFGTPHVQERIRYEARYLMQFLDLVKLHQCIGPSVRAVTEHVEYEADSWITASLVTRQINLQARNIAEAFRNCGEEDMPLLQKAIRLTAKTVILNSIGAERGRFKNSEVKDEVVFKTLNDFEFESEDASYNVVKFVVEKEAISFHHALHYTLSWLIENGKSLPAETMRSLINFTAHDLQAPPRLMGKLQMPTSELNAEDFLIAAFDYPIRVCVWLAQIKAGMWVRNGMSLRHQANTYRGVGHRDVSHHRDIFMIQTALVTCNPSRILASIVDRFGMDPWVKGIFELKSEAQDDNQHLDITEDMIHLLIILLSDRTSLIAPKDEPNSRLLAMRRDILHVLCFKPLSFNDIATKLPERYQEQEDFQEVLDEMTIYKPPEGVSDVGHFELRPEFIEDIDPYIAHYNKNQREESETAYRKKMAKKTGKTPEEIVYEPKLRAIPSGLFEKLGNFVNTGIFCQIIYYSLLYPLKAGELTPRIPATRLETFLHIVLHLILLAIQEDKTSEEDMDEESLNSFTHIALTRFGRFNFMSEDQSQTSRTIVSLLNLLSTREEFKSAHPKIALVLKRLKQKRPSSFESAFRNLGIAIDRVNTASPASNTIEEEKERKKKAALSRQAKVMAQFQQQQRSFMESQQGELDWGSDIDEDEDVKVSEDGSHTWSYPTGTCILCQEETNNGRLYGTFALVSQSCIIRQTDFQDPDLVREASQTPCNLDRSAEDIRPFGIARENRKMVQKLNTDGEAFLAERQTIGKGFPGNLCRKGPVATGCGHLMHFHCFEAYFESTQRRHTLQIARHHPEVTKKLEFVCPLCKALGNAFIPIVWKGLEESYPSYLQPSEAFDDFLEKELSTTYWSGGKAPEDSEPKIPDLDTPSLPGSLVESMVSSSMNAEQLAAQDDGDSSETSTDTPSVGIFSAGSTPGAWPVTLPTGEGNEGRMAKELLAAYRRLKGTLRVNDLTTRYLPEINRTRTEELWSSDTLVQAVSYSISATEIQQRGVEAQPGLTYLEKIPDQALTNLRILAETAASYITVGARHGTADKLIEKEHQKDAERQHCQLFMTRYFGKPTEYARRPLDSYEPLMDIDVFNFFVECAYGFGPAHDVSIAHLLRLCYLAEIVKAVYHMGRNMPIASFMDTITNRSTQDPVMHNFAEFMLTVTKFGIEAQVSAMADVPELGENIGFQQPGVDTLESWYGFVKKYALVFLRKSVLFMNVKFGVNFSSHSSRNGELDELDRLTEVLRVPNFDEMCAALTPNAGACGWPESTQQVVSGWVKHEALWPRGDSMTLPRSAPMPHPGIFELIGLPKAFDTLIEEATRGRCRTTGKDLTDPVICLFCGELHCSQGTCCSIQDPDDPEDVKIGGCQQHLRK